MATPEFRSPEELKALLDLASRRLHYINRVAGGESRYIWHLAQVIRAAGGLVDLIDDAETELDFGNGYEPGRLDRAQARERILELLAERLH